MKIPPRGSCTLQPLNARGIGRRREFPRYAIGRCLLAIAVACLLVTSDPSAHAQEAKAPPAESLTPENVALMDALTGAENLIGMLRACGKPDAASGYEQELESLKQMRQGQYTAPAIEGGEAHFIGLDRGGPPPAGMVKGAKRFTTSYAEVHVTATGPPQVLVLHSRAPIWWSIKAGEQVPLLAVVLIGAPEQRIVDRPKGVLLLDRASRKVHNEPGLSALPLGGWVRDVTGCALTTRLGDRHFGGGPLVVGPENPAWRVQHLKSAIDRLVSNVQTDLDALPLPALRDAEFHATYFLPFAKVATSGNSPRVGGYARFGLRGPKSGSLRPLPEGVQAVSACPLGKSSVCFALNEHGDVLQVIDHQDGVPTSRAEMRKLHAPERVDAIACDSKRGRLLCATSKRRSKIMTFDFKTAEWSTLESAPEGAKGLAYAEQSDTLYALVPNERQSGRRRGGSQIYQFRGAAQVGPPIKTELDLTIDVGFPEVPRVQMFHIDGHLVVIIPPVVHREHLLAGRISVVELPTGRVAYTAIPKLQEFVPAAENVSSAVAKARAERRAEQAAPSSARANGGPHLARVVETLSQLDGKIANLRAAGKSAEAAQLVARVAHERRQLVDGIEMRSDEPEFYLVGAGTPGEVSVDVTHTSNPVVLACCATEPVKWTVRAADGVRLERLIVAGRRPQIVAAAPDGVRVENVSQGDRSENNYVTNPYRTDDAIRLERLRRQAGRPPKTVQVAPSEGTRTVTVGPSDADWVLQRAMRRLSKLLHPPSETDALLADLRKVRFRAGYRTYNPDYPGARLSLAEFTHEGPLVTSYKKLPYDASHVVYDPQDRRIFAIGRRDVYEVDPKSGEGTPMPVRDALPELSGPCALAIDVPGRQVFLASQGGEGYLYCYDLKKNVWSEISSLENQDLKALCYDPRTEYLHAIVNDRQCRLITMTRSGKVVDSTPIRVPGESFRFDSSMQLVALDRYVAVLTSQPEDSRRRPLPGNIVLFEPKSGRRLYAGLLRERPGVAHLNADEIAGLWKELAGDDAKAADAAAWKLAAGEDTAINFVLERIATIRMPDAEQIRGLVAQLDNDQFAKREAASRKLAELGPVIEGELSKYAGRGSAEARRRIASLLERFQASAASDPRARQRQGAIAVLERNASPKAIEALRKLVVMPDAPAGLKKAAEAAVKRIEAAKFTSFFEP